MVAIALSPIVSALIAPSQINIELCRNTVSPSAAVNNTAAYSGSPASPRISGILHVEGTHFNYAMSILKSNDGDPDSCHRYTFAYENPKAGQGHFIHTYMHDGDPLPSFEGEPKLVSVCDDMDAFTDLLWNNLNEDNKVSLFVRYINLENGTYKTKIVNKNK